MEEKMASTTPKPKVESQRVDLDSPGRRGWLWAVLALALVAGALIVLAWLIPTTTDTQSEAFAEDPDQLIIDVTGGVSLTAGDQTELTITTEWLFAGEPVVSISNEDGIIRVTGKCSWFQIRCITSVSGTVAPDAAIEVTTSAGTIEVSGTRSGVDLETSAGAVLADGVTGPASLITSSGDIIGSITDGDVVAATSSGQIELSILGDFSNISATTSAGNVDLTVTDNVYDVEADTAAGSVNVGVRTDPSSSRQIHAETSSGSITINPAP